MSEDTVTAAVPAVEAATQSAVRHGVKALVASSSRVLLVQERHADGTTFWTLPGGGVHPGEPPVDALRRELREELRCEAVVGRPRSAFWYAHLSTPTVTVYTVFDCSVTDGVRPVPGEGILDAAWVDPARPPARTLLQVRRLLGSDR